MKNLSENLYQCYTDAPEKIAITLLQSKFPDLPIPYRKLLLGSSYYSHALRSKGIKAGDLIIIILPQSEDLIYSFFGAILHGAIPSIMPFLTEKLSPEAYRQSLMALFKISRPAAIITNRDFHAEVEHAINGAPSIRSILLAEERNLTTDIHPDSLQGLKQSGNEVVLLQHSSGTTGLQKGVALSHRAIFNQIESYSQAIKLNSSLSGKDVIVSWLPLYHDMGLIAGFILPILSQSHLILMSPFDWVRAPYKLLQTITKYHGTLTWLPNFAYNFCAQKIRSHDLEGIDLSTLRAVINCSEPMYLQSHEMFLQRFQAYGLRPDALATCYAMAENVFAVTQGGIDEPVTIDPVDREALAVRQVAVSTDSDHKAVKILSAGKPINNTKIQIIDKGGNALPERHIGEIILYSDCMLTGYYRRPDLTKKAFHDGWYLTGDLGYLVNGELYITGRKKDLIIVGGKNIYPQDLEQIASEVPGVHPGRVAAFGIFNEAAGTEEVVIVAEINEHDPLSKDRIANEIRERVTQSSDIALRKVKLVHRGWLIKTSSGKVARSANREKYLRSKLDTRGFVS